MRICGDYRLTVNHAAKSDTYPLPRVDDIFASLSGGKIFSKLDLANDHHDLCETFITIPTGYIQGIYH